MKVLVALIAFLFVLSFNLQSVAEEHGNAHQEEAATCSKEAAKEGKDCVAGTHAEAGHDAHGKTGHGANHDWSHKRQEQVSAILPIKQKNPAVAQAPGKVKLKSPKFLSKIDGTSVKLEWSEAEGAKSYHVQVSKDAGFNNRSMYVVEDKNVTGTSFEVTGLEAGVKYFWRVAARNADQDAMYTKSGFVSSEFETK